MPEITMLYANGRRVSKEFKTRGKRYEAFFAEASEHYLNGEVVAVYVDGRPKLCALSPREREIIMLRSKT